MHTHTQLWTVLQVIVPNLASMREPDAPVVVDTLYWMREAELKHGRCVLFNVHMSTTV
jgi:hypothetical protein